VVDDEDIVRDMVQAMLSRSGYEVVAVPGGREAIETLRDAPETIDLVILDMVMPGLSGRETFLRVREARPGIPVVLCSGFGLNGEAQALLDEGVRAFLTKPYTMNELLDCVESILGAR
jgi:CheY-like chemotaxis protein